jgi:succinate dehydrogenase / fumarate reductase membrane anchor subunit
VFSVTRSTGSARSGLGEWLAQRLTALYMAGFSVFAVVYLLISPRLDFVHWQSWMSNPGVRIALALFFVSALVHAWLGLRSVFMDYLKPAWLRFTVLSLTLLALLAQGVWVGDILLWGFHA